MKYTIKDVYNSAGEELTNKILAVVGEENVVEWFYKPNKKFQDKSPHNLCEEKNSATLDKVMMDILTAAQGG
jgi:hypothetical protein